MKKTLVGILVFDMIMGMLCLWAGGKRQDTTAPASQEVSTGKITGEEDVVKKIALTFDDDVIIGLSQEISYKEAVSMI